MIDLLFAAAVLAGQDDGRPIPIEPQVPVRAWHNRLYKQGLYLIAGQEISFFCRGQGGIAMED